jgi:hypothetical protein
MTMLPRFDLEKVTLSTIHKTYIRRPTSQRLSGLRYILRSNISSTNHMTLLADKMASITIKMLRYEYIYLPLLLKTLANNILDILSCKI